jgi:hypothetical protein
MMIVGHLALAAVLFLCVNWIGKHAVDFGYSSTTLFEEPNESIALNFFLRACSPAVFLIAVAAGLEVLSLSELRFNLYFVALYYYLLRAVAILVVNRQGLISWTRYTLHATAGIAIAYFAYVKLIVPNQSLLPNFEQAGNELWLAIAAFLYAVANKVALPTGPGARRRNAFIAAHYAEARNKFGSIVDGKVKNDALKLVTYSILIYEDYARPKAIRFIERLMWWKKSKTTGIMQVKSEKSLTDEQSVKEGIEILLKSWKKKRPPETELFDRVRGSIVDYNKDSDYASKVLEVMEILAKRVDTKFKSTYEKIYPYPSE